MTDIVNRDNEIVWERLPEHEDDTATFASCKFEVISDR